MCGFPAKTPATQGLTISVIVARGKVFRIPAMAGVVITASPTQLTPRMRIRRTSPGSTPLRVMTFISRTLPALRTQRSSSLGLLVSWSLHPFVPWSLRPRLNILPPPMNPQPLLWTAADQLLQRSRHVGRHDRDILFDLAGAGGTDLFAKKDSQSAPRHSEHHNGNHGCPPSDRH